MIKRLAHPKDEIQDVCAEYPCPWHTVESKSGIIIKDATGASVLFLPFTGLTTRARKRRTAKLITDAVNGAHGNVDRVQIPAASA